MNGNKIQPKPQRWVWTPWAVFIYAVLCWLVHPNGAVRTGLLVDPDDYMRLNQTFAWLQGQSWWDMAQPRLSPGAGTWLPWARWPDVLLALIAWPVAGWLGLKNALLFASFILPPLLFGGMVVLVVAMARLYVKDERANNAAFLLLGAPLVLNVYAAGAVDHHGYVLLVAGFGFWTLARMIEANAGWCAAMWSGLAFALGLWLGTEMLPWVLLFVGCLGCAAAWRGSDVARQAAKFGAAFWVATMLVWPLALPVGRRFEIALSWFSFADVILAGLVAVWFGVGWLATRRIVGRGARSAVYGVLGLGVTVALVVCVPQVLQGPFADYNDFDASIALQHIGEAKPLKLYFLHAFTSWYGFGGAVLTFLPMLFLPVLGLVGLVVAWRRQKGTTRLVILANAAFLLAALLLTLFWQVRVGRFAQLFALAPALYMILRVGRYAAWRWWWFKGVAGQALLFLACSFMPVVLVPALARDAPVWSGVALFPAARPAATCPLLKASAFLADGEGYGAVRHTIISGSNEGPELLFRTPHNVVAANFNVAGNADVYAFFRERDDDEAQKIAAKWKADLVLVCRSFPLSYARIDPRQLGRGTTIRPMPDGSLHLAGDQAHPTLIERLVRGQPPAWLKPVAIPDDKDYLLYEIRK